MRDRIKARLLGALAGGVGAAALAPLVVPIPPLRGTVPVQELAGPDARFVPVALRDGPTIAVHTTTRGTPTERPAVVLLHHFFGSTVSWRHLLDPLGDRGHVVAFDRPAFGLTERPARSAWAGRDPYTRAANAELTVGLLDALGIDRAVLVGASAGGTVALEVALARPDRIAALVLVAPAVNGDVGPPPLLRPLLRTPQLRRLGPLALRRIGGRGLDRLQAAYHDPDRATEADLDGYRVPLKAERWDEALYDTMVAEPPPHLGPRLPEITVPALVVSGASDGAVTPAQARATAAALGDGRFVALPACGHLPMEECPEDLLAAVVPFLDEVAAG